jgi:hypothetical protein
LKNYRKHIDDLFREKLGSYTETPPPDVWEDLSQRLDGLQPTPGFPSRLLLHISMASLLLVLGISVVKKFSASSYSPASAVNSSPASTEEKNNAVAITSATDQNSGEAGAGSAEKQEAANAPSTEDNSAVEAAGTVAKQLPGNRVNHIAAAKNQPASRSGKHNNVPNAHYASANNKTPLNQNNGDVENTASTAPAFNAPLQANTTVQTVPAVLKKNIPLTAKTSKDLLKGRPADLNRFEMGIKGGYEKGFSDGAAAKYVVSPYLQYNITRKISVMLQPAIKSATVNQVNIGAPQSSYQITGTKTPTHNGKDSTVYNSGGTTSTPTTYGNYTYSQTHDSMVRSYAYGGSYMEFELPVLLKYKVSKKFSLYGGVTLNYSKLLNINQNTFTKTGLTVTKDSMSGNAGSLSSAALPTSSVIKYPGYTISESNGPLYVSPQGSMLRCGYMIGFSYEYSKRWLLDGSIEQSPVKSYLQGGNNLYAPFSATYFRLSIGYKIIQ